MAQKDSGQDLRSGRSIGMATKPQSGPLQGIRILDLTRLYPGPLGTMMLADMGADVIKVEDMKAPDYMRFYPPYIESESAGFLAVNRSKRSLAIHLKSEKGVGIFFDLLKTADIVIEQFRPGVLDSLGIGYAAEKKSSRRLFMYRSPAMARTDPTPQPPHTILILSAMPASSRPPGRRRQAPSFRVHNSAMWPVALTCPSSPVFPHSGRGRRPAGASKWMWLCSTASCRS